MRKILLSILVTLAFSVSAIAQGYDLYYVLPGAAGSKGVDVGLGAAEISSIGDVGVVNTMGKYSISDELEVGVLGELGVLKDGADALSRLTVGAKYGMGESRALTADLRVVDEATEELGLRIGAMHTISSGELMINNAFQVGLLDGYTGGVGVALDLLIEPTKAFGDKLTGYLDILVSNNTDDIGGDFLAINVGPNVDVHAQRHGRD